MDINNLPEGAFVVRNPDGSISHIWVPEEYMNGIIWVKYIPE